MSQEPYNKNDKNNLPRFSNRPNNSPKEDDPNQPPKKGPRFSIYWIYAIIFAVLIGFQFYSPFAPNMKEIDQDNFLEILQKGDVAKYTIINNRNKVKVTLKESSLGNYDLKTGISGKIAKEGPHMFFSIVSGDSFKDDMRKFYTDHPSVKDVGKVDNESDWFSKSLSFLLPVLLFVGLWILLMRKMGGGAG